MVQHEDVWAVACVSMQGQALEPTMLKHASEGPFERHRFFEDLTQFGQEHDFGKASAEHLQSIRGASASLFFFWEKHVRSICRASAEILHNKKKHLYF